jgi:hypothetical protein
MNKWFVIAIVALGLFLGAPLMAQGGGGKGNWGKNKNYKNPNGQGNGNGSNGQGNGPGNGNGNNGQGNGAGNNGQGGSDWLKKQEDAIGWGESGTEERIEPGDTVKDADKTTRLEAEADKLGLEDKKIRKDFIKYAKLGWDKAEKEDSRWSKEVKKIKDDPEALEKGKTGHRTKLDEAWASADESQIEKEVLTSEQLEKFKTNTKDLREKTATDLSMEQDVIRARKVEELKKRAEDWAKANGGGDKEDNEVKKEKKEEEGEGEPEEEKKD